MIKVAQILRYPVKGLSAEPLKSVQLQPDLGIPHDRRFALAHSATDLDLLKSQWLSKTHFLMLMRDERLAALETLFDSKSSILSIWHNGEKLVSGDLTRLKGRAEIEDFFTTYMEIKGRPHLVEAAPGKMFSDHRARVLSIVNPASIVELEKKVGTSLNPIRFRPNIILEGAEAWDEFQWLGREIVLGGARLKVTVRINRCAATNVDPDTGNRHMNLPKALQRDFGHVDMGVYAQVLDGGTVAVGDELKIL